MNEKDLKKLKRLEILELFLKEKEKNEALEKEIEELKLQLEEKNITLGTAGSMAEAAMKLNGVFEAADAAAAQYLESIRQLGRQRILLLKKELEQQNNDK